MISHLLLAVDVETSNEATRVAGDLAEATGADVKVLHYDELDSHFDTAVWLDDDTELRTPVGDAVTQLRHRGVTARGVTSRTASSKATAQAVLREERGSAADILIMGLPKFHHVGGLFVGSVAAEVAAHTRIPLLLVPAP